MEGRGAAHFREEEERLFPLLLVDGAVAPESLTQALLDHARLRALSTRLRAQLELGEVESRSLLEPGELLERHVRLEERELFSLIELRASDRLEQALEPTPPTRPDDGEARPVDLARAMRGFGPQWGMQSDELNATLLAWRPDHRVAPHRNDERDVLMIVIDGSAVVALDEVEHAIVADELLLLPRGSTRALTAGPDGVRYVSIHMRRDPLLPTSRRQTRSPAAS